jgi:hypothetical protein
MTQTSYLNILCSPFSEYQSVINKEVENSRDSYSYRGVEHVIYTEVLQYGKQNNPEQHGDTDSNVELDDLKKELVAFFFLPFAPGISAAENKIIDDTNFHADVISNVFTNGGVEFSAGYVGDNTPGNIFP